jgi:UDP-N-acetylglucosamine--dolichyl-phosphate N-acetylglucosaminephosphotransferase
VFLFFNVYPASVFPGDTLTYGVGAIIGTVAILADIEKFALFLILPYFVELVLKGRTFFQKASWAKADWDGSLTNRYGRWYGWPNVMISLLNGTVGRAREWQVVALIWCVQACCAVFTLAAYYRFIPV